MSFPRVSILMPAYNVEKYIGEAIDSMLMQTYTDFELILLDDCSTDNTAKIIKYYTDKRIVYHRNESNVGLANNLNIGLLMARGEYIARMDGDDISLPNRLQTQIDFLESHPGIDLCSCGLQMFGTESTVWIRDFDLEQVKITMLFYSPILHATSVWRKKSFERYSLYYDQIAFPAEDYDLWSRAIFFCKLVNIPQVLYKYRIHGVQVTKMDSRAIEKTREIQIKYLVRALPSLQSNFIDHFVDKFIHQNGITIQNVTTLKPLYRTIIEANKRDNFFDDNLLNDRLKRYYQALVFSLLKENKELYSFLLLDLRLTQLFKLILKWE